ncbi:MAG TPA: Gfo/Idh/MocA family oxidoreductase [Opitutaceae bacterium]|nr:Gfo/Idh/MocA family oxidoreductase [Opitutaceae bacterium]
MKSSPAPLGFGIIGTGMIAGYHAKAIAQVTGARLVGAASLTADNVRTFAEKHQLGFWTTKAEELVARPDIHVVCVTTPSGVHLDPALAAIRAGKHVVIEKPLEVTTARADRILDAADQAGVRVCPIFQARFGQGARTLKAAIDAGRFGRIAVASAYVKWYRAPAYYTGWKGKLALDGGGALINQAIHGLDLLQWFAGLPEEVSAYKTRVVHRGIEGEDTAVAALRYPSGALGTLEASTACWPGWSRKIEICGETGSVALEDDHLARWEFKDAQPGDDEIRNAKVDPSMRSGAGSATAISYEGHLRQIQDLVDALRDRRPLAIEGREGRKAVALVNAVYQSAEQGRPVRVA